MRHSQKHWPSISNIIVFAAVCTLLSAASFAQTVKSFSFSGDGPNGEMFMIQEVGGLVTLSDDGVKIEMVMPPDQRPKEFKDVDLMAGDIIKMANGKKIDDVAKIKEIYEALKPGETLKFGINRDGKMMIVSMVKGDPDKMPKMQVMTVGAGDNMIPTLIDVGLVLVEKDGKLVVDQAIPEMVKSSPDFTPGKDDILAKINGTMVNNASSLSDAYMKIAVGSKVEMTFERAGEQHIVSFDKPEAMNKQMKMK